VERAEPHELFGLVFGFMRTQAVSVAETVIHEGPDPTLRKLFDLHMLVLLGGKERTEEEWRALLGAERFEPRTIAGGLIDARPA